MRARRCGLRRLALTRRDASRRAGFEDLSSAQRKKVRDAIIGGMTARGEIEEEEEGPSRLKRINSKKSEVVYAMLENGMSISKVARLNNIQIAEVVVLCVSEEFSMPSDGDLCVSELLPSDGDESDGDQ